MNDIDRIKLEVINNRLKYNELLELYIRYLKVRQSMMSKIPSYNKDYKYYINDRRSNCYGYAFRFDMPDYFDYAFKYFDSNGFYFEPGCFSNMYDINTESTLLEAIYRDLDTLEIKYCEDLDNEYLYKVAIFQEHSYLYDSDDIPDFHFSRLNSNGLWSCKNGIGGGIEKGNRPLAGFSYKLIKILDINK